MSRFKDNPNIYDQLICLSEKEKLAPMEVIKDFFAYYRLSELRDIQDQIQQVCLTSDGEAFNHSKRRAELLAYNDKLIRLLEAATQLGEIIAPSASPQKATLPEQKLTPVKNYDPRISDLVKGINDVGVDVAHLCVIIVNAWTAKVCAEMKLPPLGSKKKTSSTSRFPPVDLDKLHSMALILQNKLAKLAGLAVDLYISELNTHFLSPQS
ncbi:MAG TPA: hypothetical protein VFE32_19285 [Puia sp.]|jgi:hypothetical protein|nr:hypothetical protein [Puia sp.]